MKTTEKAERMGVRPASEKNTKQMSLYQENKKRSVLDWLILGVVVGIALVVMALSFQNSATLASELGLNPYLTAGLVEILFASLLFIRGRQRATMRNVPLFLSIGYFVSLGFVTGVNMYGLYQESPLVGPIVGGAISGAMWLMESVLVWLWVDSHKPHEKSLKEIKKEAEQEIKKTKIIQRIDWMRWEAEKPDLKLIREARQAEERRKETVADGLPIFFEPEPEPERPKLELVPPIHKAEPEPEPKPEPKPKPKPRKKQKPKTDGVVQLGLF